MFYVNDLEMEISHTYQFKPKGKKKFETQTTHIGGLKIDSYGIPIDKVCELAEAIEGCFEHDPVDVAVKWKSQNY